MNLDNKEPENKSGSDIDDKELDKLIEPFKEGNPDMTLEEAEELKKALKSLMEANQRQFRKSEYIKKFFKSLIMYLLSSISVLGFLFSFLVLENKLASLLLPICITFILSIYEIIKFIKFIKKPIIISIKPYIIDMTIICLLGYLFNEFVKVFEYSIIFSLYILLTFIMKMLVNLVLNKKTRKKIIVERRDKDV